METNTRDSLISRQAAIKTINKIRDVCDTESLDDYRDLLVECFEVMPPAQPEQRWIPVTERLPEDEYVLISKKPTKISGDKWSVAMAIRTADPRSGKIQWRDSGFGIIQDDKVLAWMPLPAPFREEGEAD